MRPTGETLRPRGRLRRKGDFEKAYAEGRRFVERSFIGFLRFRGNGGGLRVGVVASRKLGPAVRRNRAKRLLRELFRRNRPPGALSADLVLVARPALLETSYSEVERAYVRGLARAVENNPLSRR